MSGREIRTMEEFAEAIGISRPTVSKYFNDPASVRKTTRDRIEAALEEHHYQPNIFAINQNRKATKCIGILVPYLSDPFFAEMVRLMERRCIDAGFWPVILSAHGEQHLENEALATMRSLRPTGALLAPLGRASDLKALERFARNVPTVVFDSNVPVGETFVGSNNFQSIPMIVDYLCRTGEPPCFMEMQPVNPNANKRRDAYIMAMEKLGYDPQVVRVEGSGWEFEQIGLELGGEMLSSGGFPSSTILCSNDRLAIGLIAAAFERGLRVGHGQGCALRVAGHDDHPLSRFTTPPLTTVSQDYMSIVNKSVATLFDLVESGERNQGNRTEILFDGKLILRSSA
ncbi:LacI family DNA-binding transcriptional regulator [Tropicimonas isoalkanivorans]|uniref:Transcriptional regulator, LacI family n=1 Tax=Tropicimonas isoalkanivorans TaxID=441112 RepID=A0A1I1MAM1_9RHOB|nr:LacI family DNA-binding transcriptional regulator [Tropicimonas isoalkanivorans]SFC80248.1 transcriptional regulator, LacI family [Tropicimonas isoalkanivorans]